ncbi:hypothetical protein [Thermococcus sp. CX2]|nr:hypothetical protein [Thermococcus sp. CX2]
MDEARPAFLLILTVLASGCLKGGNFVYVKGKTPRQRAPKSTSSLAP